MRLVLDEMYPPVAAELLRQRGIDALAVKESAELTGLGDRELPAFATVDQRVLVTENVADFVVLARTEEHVGIVFCHPRRFPRDPDHIPRLVTALAALLKSAPLGLGSQPIQWWLEQAPTA
ncbi:MAG: DUF5615 family PIN-like protein [Acidimicrobiia bacterium]